MSADKTRRAYPHSSAFIGGQWFSSNVLSQRAAPSAPGRLMHGGHLNDVEHCALRIGDRREPPHIRDIHGSHANLAAELPGAGGAFVAIRHRDVDHPVRRDTLPLAALHGQSPTTARGTVPPPWV